MILRYIELDKESYKVIVHFPLVSGDTIGLENTCQSGVAMQEFFKSFKNEYALARTDLINWIAQGIQQGKSIAEVQKRSVCLKKLDNYHHDFDYIMAREVREGSLKRTWFKKYFNTRTPIVPPEVMELIQHDPCLGSIRIDTHQNHEFERFSKSIVCSFGVRKKEGLERSIFKDKLKHWLVSNLEKLRKTKNQADSDTSWKDKLINELELKIRKHLMTSATGNSEDVFEKNITEQEFQTLMNMIYLFLNSKFQEVKSVHTPEKIVKLSIIDQVKKSVEAAQPGFTKDFSNNINQEGLTNSQFYQYLLTINRGVYASDIITTLTYHLQLKDLVIFPESNVMRMSLESNSGFYAGAQHFTQDPIARINLAIQFFIGVINSYLIAQDKVPQTVNFGHIIEGISLKKDKKNVDENKQMVSSLLERLDHKSLEDFEWEIISWINDNKACFSLKNDITREDREKISELFLGCFNTVKAKKHWDEFLIRVPLAGNSLFQSRNNMIIADFDELCRIGFNIPLFKLDKAIKSYSNSSSSYRWSLSDVLQIVPQPEIKLILKHNLLHSHKESPWYRNIFNLGNLDKISKSIGISRILIKNLMGYNIEDNEITKESLKELSAGGNNLLILLLYYRRYDLIHQILSHPIFTKDKTALIEYLVNLNKDNRSPITFAFERGCELSIIESLWKVAGHKLDNKQCQRVFKLAVDSNVYANFNFLLTQTQADLPAEAYSAGMVQLIIKNKFSGFKAKFFNGFFNDFLKTLSNDNAVKMKCLETLKSYFARIYQANSKSKNIQIIRGNIAILLLSLVQDNSSNADYIIDIFVQAKCSLNCVPHKSSKSLLMYVSEIGELQKIQYFINHKANINQKDQYGETALMYAIKNKKIAAVKLLLQNGANMEMKNSQGKTAMDLADDNNSKDIKKLLDVCYKYSSTSNQSEMIDLLSQQKDLLTGMYFYKFKGFLPLGWAIFKNYHKVAKKLLESSLDVNAVDKNHRSALEIAISMIKLNSNQTMDVLKTLLQYPTINLDIQNKNQENMLIHAVNSGCGLPVIKLLVTSGIDTLYRCKGRDVIDYAAIKGNNEVLRYLISRLSNKRITVKQRLRRLDEFIRAGTIKPHTDSLKMLQQLAKHDQRLSIIGSEDSGEKLEEIFYHNKNDFCANINFQDEKGMTLLMHIVEQNDQAAFSSLLTLGAGNINLKDFQGRTAMSIAKANSNLVSIYQKLKCYAEIFFQSTVPNQNLYQYCLDNQDNIIWDAVTWTRRRYSYQPLALLHIAIKQKNLSLLQYVFPKVRECFRYSSALSLLRLAAKESSIECFRWLLSQGRCKRDLNDVRAQGLVDLAFEGGNLDVLCYLGKFGVISWPLEILVPRNVSDNMRDIIDDFKILLAELDIGSVINFEYFKTKVEKNPLFLWLVVKNDFKKLDLLSAVIRSRKQYLINYLLLQYNFSPLIITRMINNAILRTVSFADISCVRLLVCYLESKNYRFYQKDKAALKALKHSNIDMVEFLLEKGGMLECKKPQFTRIFDFVVDNGDVRAFKYFVKFEEFFNKQFVFGGLGLLKRVLKKKGKLGFIKFLYHFDNSMIESVDKNHTALMLASKLGNSEYVKYLVGVDRSRDSFNQSLELAAKHNKIECLAALLAALLAAKQRDHTPIINRILQKKIAKPRARQYLQEYIKPQENSNLSKKRSLSQSLSSRKKHKGNVEQDLSVIQSRQSILNSPTAFGLFSSPDNFTTERIDKSNQTEVNELSISLDGGCNQ
ncbi:MAG TPA: ankyrin repeat domain-containing protein [Gammaproteobacteria bacterium]|nr:ankyrin repeat domain-containing protein [Gammaproteobacteria bacterium]